MQLQDVGLTFEEVKAYTEKYLIDTYERFPFLVTKAKDMYLYDQDGNAYLDFYGGIAVNSAGNCNEKVVAAVIQQTQEVMHVFNYPYSIPEVVFAKLLVETTGLDRVYFQSTGTEANEAMIKLARKYGTDNYGPERYHIITAKKSFHGRTFGAMTATGQPESAIHKGFGPLVPGFTYAEFNNVEAFAEQVTKDTIAIMLEPIQGEGGVNPATKEFLTGIEKLCRDNDMLLLIDEIQTGCYRTGYPMAYMYYGVSPDIISMAKTLGGGLPLAGILAKEHVAKSFTPGSHGSTYSGNPVACAAGYAEFKELIDRELGKNAAETGEYFMEKLRALPHVKDVRGRGFLVGLELDVPKAVEVKHNAIDRKLLTTAIGDSIVRMVPPLIASREDCDKAAEILRDSIEALG
ncbi:MAG: acetylornithine/succinylornithine family transaminase [Clostridiales Family XIII bacterium]|jgi:acetylornithine/N-succinyldiaminopimelate aminotransferase|nr:acetylornithine/succinylornithine family transaminase [Clostridiales Family XIII bacterium]